MIHHSTQVLIAGGGPVGLTLGHVLARYGVPFMLVERNAATTRHPKMDLTNSRSMELFARCGVAHMLRAAGVPDHHEMTIRYATSMFDSALELHRFDYPSTQRYREIMRERNDGTQPAEPPLRVSQAVLEPTLKNALERVRGSFVRYGCALHACEDHGDRVIATLRESATGTLEEVECAYLVGCDGAGSTARAALGIRLEGDTGLRPSYMVHFRSNRLDQLQRWGVTWHRRLPRASIIAQDDKETWTLQYRIDPDGHDMPESPEKLLHEIFGVDFDAEVIVANPWKANLLVADSFGRGRIFLAGDSVHQFVPTGGYGMNTGVGDAFDLGWKLAATLQSWGGKALLESYEIERRPVALTNREASRRHVQTRQVVRDLFDQAGELEGDSPEIRLRRDELAQKLRDIGNDENESFGVEYGYRYDNSPIVAHEGGTPPAFDALANHPSTWPGSRLPSTFLPDETMLFDHLGPWFTLIAFANTPIGSFESDALDLGVPVTVIHLADQQPGTIYERRLLLVRPDHHIAWRGNDAPDDWMEVLKRSCGKS